MKYLKLPVFLSLLCLVQSAPSEPKLPNQIAALLEDHLTKIDGGITLKLECTVCIDSMKAFHFILGNGISKKCMSALIDYLCTTLHIEDNHICKAISSEFQVG